MCNFSNLRNFTNKQDEISKNYNVEIWSKSKLQDSAAISWTKIITEYCNIHLIKTQIEFFKLHQAFIQLQKQTNIVEDNHQQSLNLHDVCSIHFIRTDFKVLYKSHLPQISFMFKTLIQQGNWKSSNQSKYLRLSVGPASQKIVM